VGSAGNLPDTLIKEKGILDITDLLAMPVPGEDVTVGEKIVPGFTAYFNYQSLWWWQNLFSTAFLFATGLFYNANLFGEGKYALPETWDEFFQLGEEAKKDGIALFTYPTAGYFDAFFYALLTQVGGPDLFNRAMNYDVDAWTSPEATKAFEIVGELAKYVHPDTVAQANVAGFTKNQQLILDNEALFVTNGTWLPNEMADAPRAAGFEWGFTHCPSLAKMAPATLIPSLSRCLFPKVPRKLI